MSQPNPDTLLAAATRFKELRQECVRLALHQATQYSEFDKSFWVENCRLCHGRGWTPVTPHLEDVLALDEFHKLDLHDASYVIYRVYFRSNGRLRWADTPPTLIMSHEERKGAIVDAALLAAMATKEA